MIQATLDTRKSEAFGQKMLATMNQAALGLMLSLGHRTGLLDAMAQMPPLTSEALAQRAGLNERYVREWLGAMVTAGVVDFDPSTCTYQLPFEYALHLTRASSTGNFASMMQWIAVLGTVEDEVVDAFRHGRGLPYSMYHRFHEVMAEESQQTTVEALEQHILPLVEGLTEKLQRGLTVMDVGCGAGRALIRLAELFPASRFVGYDLCEDAIEGAKRQARKKGLENVRFQACDVAGLTVREAFDLVLAFDAIHDQARPAEVLSCLRRALKRDGVFLMQDIAASTHLQNNLEHPMGTFLYTISCMHCMSVALWNGGQGLGAVWGKELALKMLREADFSSVRVETLPHDLINFYYIAR